MLLRRYQKNKSGGASLLLTVVLGFLVVGLVIGLTNLSVRESRQSTDIDQSSRALRAAQDGVEKAALKLSANPTYKQNACNAADSTPDTPEAEIKLSDTTPYNGSTDIAITCSIVTTGSVQNYKDILDRDKSDVIDLSDPHYLDAVGNLVPTNIKYIRLNWDAIAGDTQCNILAVPADPACVRYNTTSNIPPQFPSLDPVNNIKWLSLPDPPNPAVAAPAMVELKLIWWPNHNPLFKQSDFSGSGGLNVKTNIVYPTKWGTSSTGQVETDAARCGSAGHLPAGSVLGQTLSYYCLMPDLSTITGSSPPTYQQSGYDITNLISTNPLGNRFFVKLTPRYSGMSYEVSFLDENLHDIVFPSPSALIDVTARSGQTYRRVKATKPLTPIQFDFIDNVIFSGKDICKNLIAKLDHSWSQYNTCDN